MRKTTRQIPLQISPMKVKKIELLEYVPRIKTETPTIRPSPLNSRSLFQKVLQLFLSISLACLERLRETGLA
jgi:hypothetical protein